MTKKEAVNHYGSLANLARARGVSRATVSNWTETLPGHHQLAIERDTRGALQADPGIPRGYVTVRKPRRLVTGQVTEQVTEQVTK
jgi:DNA-binding transcriptional regulator YdaS (Cro superfamily)